MHDNNFVIFLNPYWKCDGEPTHLARFIEDDTIYLCGWHTEYNLPRLKHNKSVIKVANEKGYKLPLWVEIPDWILKIC